MQLQKQIQCQGQQGGILVFLAVSGHQQQKKHHQQICRIKIPGKQLL